MSKRCKSHLNNEHLLRRTADPAAECRSVVIDRAKQRSITTPAHSETGKAPVSVFLYAKGDFPLARLNARLKLATESYPTR